jgi:hypothetical protein
MNDAEVKRTVNQVQRYETCKALVEGRLSLHVGQTLRSDLLARQRWP